MRLARDRLVFLCLAALDDILRQCATAPAAPSPQFRAVLATLYALGDLHERTVFDAIWQSSQLAPSPTLTEHQANHRRMSELARMWPMVCRQVGVEPTTELALALAALRRPRETAAERAARTLREQEHERRVFDRHRRQKQQCTIRG
ncbi:MAG: hypothetical protein ACTHJR_17310 [Sphingomonas sp.]|uniref:hypothetical protein n=1 Tax=Sphingomonas sp. TaxID=28214 RepID=UPI003F7F9946